MKKLLGIVVLGLLLCGNAYAEWLHMTKLSNNDQKVYIDLETYEKNGNQVFIWMLADWTVPYKGIKSITMYEQINCSTKSSTTLQHVFYDGQMGTGKPKSFKRDNEKLKTYSTGSFEYSLIKVLCDK